MVLTMAMTIGMAEMVAVAGEEAEVLAEAGAEEGGEGVGITTAAAVVTSAGAMATMIEMVEIMGVEGGTLTTAETLARGLTTLGSTSVPGTTPRTRTTAAAVVTRTIATTTGMQEVTMIEEPTTTGPLLLETTPLTTTAAAVEEIPTIATSPPATGTTTEEEGATTAPYLLVTRQCARGAVREIAALVEIMEHTLLRRLDTSLGSPSSCFPCIDLTYWIKRI